MLELEQIEKLQKGYKVTALQEMIQSGDVWKLEGSVGRLAMTCLENGICFLGKYPRFDYYGNFVPPRGMVEEGSKGSLLNAQNFWQKVQDGDFEVIDALEQLFGADEENEVK